ncbi:MBL fold metallo-hydrolase [Colwellia sp. UCD-KL20]|uniref:ComEC/Rec2 family competence protein n=1 Tax=Colwellia sp. UCD-KL20 TaxID=1917165 RepID=UPI000970AA9C|nr:MBL fold metallo-hydrolase [Colwellia sp. UCD-KL20]
MALNIKALPANHGDCFVIEDTSDGYILVVDCGLKITYQNHLRKIVQKADTLILTHIDEDHILGAIPLIESIPESFKLGDIYFNSPELLKYKVSSGNISVRQAKQIDQLLLDKGINCLGLISEQNLNLTSNLKLHIISPRNCDLLELNKSKFDEDSKSANISSNNSFNNVMELSKQKDSYLSISSDLVNACSIAFILNYKDKKMLYLADAHPEIIADYIESLGYNEKNKLIVDIVKLSHHGSYKNISDRLVSFISCDTFWISTNGGKSRSKHPGPSTLAKLATKVDRNKNCVLTFLFNYSIEEIESRNGCLMTCEDKQTYKVVLKEQNEVVWL